jgi:imidazoleglycerol-phosphate dehydratase
VTRSASRERTTKETSISVRLDVDGPAGEVRATTGLPFFDHMLDQLGRHGGFDLVIEATGDLHVDGHHTVEDVAITVGECFREALGD